MGRVGGHKAPTLAKYRIAAPTECAVGRRPKMSTEDAEKEFMALRQQRLLEEKDEAKRKHRERMESAAAVREYAEGKQASAIEASLANFEDDIRRKRAGLGPATLTDTYYRRVTDHAPPRVTLSALVYATGTSAGRKQKRRKRSRSCGKKTHRQRRTTIGGS